jgi:serine/threonine-protein phosphatase 4 regulatory subunit 1
MVHHIFPHLYALVSDPDNEVRRAASETIVKLALRVDPEDVVTLCLSVPLRLVKEGQKRASSSSSSSAAGAAGGGTTAPGASAPATGIGGGGGNTGGVGTINPLTPAEDLLTTSSNLLADLSSFLPPPRLPPEVATRYLTPAILALSDDPNFRVRRAAVQAIPRMLGSATLEDVRRRLLPKFAALSGDEMYRVRKASGECLVDVSRALGILPWRTHFGDVWMANGGGDDGCDVDGGGVGGRTTSFYRRRTREQVDALLGTVRECHEIRRRVLCGIARKLLEDTNKFVRYGMMQFLGPLIASFYPLDRGCMIGGMGGLMYDDHHGTDDDDKDHMGTLGIGVESVDIAKSSTGLERMMGATGGGGASSAHHGEFGRGTTTIEDVFSYNHSLHGLEMILHGESTLNHAVLGYGGGCNANKDPFGTMGPQFFPHANGMVGRSSALDDDDTDSFLLRAYIKSSNPKQHVVVGQAEANDPSSSSSQIPSSYPSSSLQQSPRALLPKFLLESRSDALALSRIVCHRTGRVPIAGSTTIATMPYPPLVSGRPDPEDLKSIANTLLVPFIGMASFQTGEESTDAEMKVYCAYSLPAVILLFGGSNWEKDGLKRCFLDLIGRNVKEESPNNAAVGADSPPNPTDAAAQQPPLPVKRCLASSVHAVAHMLGPDVASRDAAFLAAFEQSFLCDPDEAIRLNVLKNLASFLGALPPGDGPGHRNAYLPMMHSLIMGDDVLGASKRRSASNPGVLNWRQRDAVARMLPDLIVLFSASLNREYLWPMLKTLLTDSVSAVRENAGWSVPVLLRRYITRPSGESEGAAWVAEVTDWLRETFLDEVTTATGARTSRGMGLFARRLKKQMTSSEGAYSRRQGYCRILAGVALAMRMGEGEGDCDDGVSLASHPNDKRMSSVPVDPFGKLSPYERDQFRSIVVNDLLPPALEMALDCVANVRLTLTKCLKVLPLDIRKEIHVEEVLSTLEEELMTWDVSDMMPNQGEFVAIE